jgi:glycopeptide antibiotics resistance protein
MTEPGIRPATGRRGRVSSRRLVIGMLVVYTALVLFVTLTPRAPGTGFVRRTVDAALAVLAEYGITGIDFLDVEFFGNILMFVPLGVFAALLLPRRRWWALLLLGTAFSAFIELYQGAFLPERFSEWRDIVSNTSGFLVGAGATVVVLLRRSRRSPADPS